MERYLLFDSGCSTCTQIAHAVEAETDGWLTAHHLGDPEVQALLKRARPDYSWEPTLLEVDGEQVQASTGLAMRARLVVGLGPRRAWRVARLVRQAGVPATGVDLRRRDLLRQGGAWLAGLTLFRLPVLERWIGETVNPGPGLDLPPGEWPRYGGRPVPPAPVDPSDLVIISEPGGGTIEAQCDSSCCACPTDGANPCGCCCGDRLDDPVGNPYWAECWDGCCTPCCYCCGWCRKQYWEVQPWYYECDDGSIELGAVPTGRYGCNLSLDCC